VFENVPKIVPVSSKTGHEEPQQPSRWIEEVIEPRELRGKTKMAEMLIGV